MLPQKERGKAATATTTTIKKPIAHADRVGGFGA